MRLCMEGNLQEIIDDIFQSMHVYVHKDNHLFDLEVGAKRLPTRKLI